MGIPEIINTIVVKVEQLDFATVACPYDADEMANSVDPDHCDQILGAV